MRLYTLLITLGHNSSATAVCLESGNMIGFEEERLSRVKSDSSFPRLAIREILKYVDPQAIQEYIVSNWFYDPASYEKTKYWDQKFIDKNIPFALRVTPYTSDRGPRLLSHHDMHAWSALGFTELYINMDIHPWHVLVIDGFGNEKECISLYVRHPDSGWGSLEKIFAVKDYGLSMGLMFQYAAESCGMDGINDVYKFLGLRAEFVNTQTPQAVDDATVQARTVAQRMWELMQTESEIADSKDVVSPEVGVNLEELRKVKANWFDLFAGESSGYVGYVVQYILEYVVKKIIDTFQIQNLAASGGCFYNVRLNGRIASSLSRLSVNPLAGDAGAALGAYRYIHGPRSVNVEDLCISPRRPVTESQRQRASTLEGFNIIDSFSKYTSVVAQAIESGIIVNVVRNTMEYGPRALGHTSTLALPTPENARHINYLNRRASVMPMAPMMTQGASRRLFQTSDLTKVIGTNHFMVCAHRIRHGADKMEGAALCENAVQSIFTARPQIVTAETDFHLNHLLRQIQSDCVINTSFNGHGSPIVYDIDEAMDLHESWIRRRDEMVDTDTFALLEEENRPKFVTYYFEHEDEIS